uniref:Uncharacterized protein n=1 Tax=Setaria italica TaxID=4555 RepID=K3Y097_SETIT
MVIFIPNVCHGIKDGGPQDCLVLAWSATDENNMFMTTVHALEKLVGSVEVALFRIALDPGRKFGFILCPDDEMAKSLHAHYVTIGMEKIFDVVRSVKYLPFL